MSTDTTFSVTSDAGSAGQALPITGATTQVRLKVPDSAQPIEYKVGSGAWARLGTSERVALDVDMTATAIRVRKAEGGDQPITIRVSADMIASTASEGGRAPPRGWLGTFPNRAVLAAAYPPATNLGNEAAIGGAAPYELRRSNGRFWTPSLASFTGAWRAAATHGRMPNNFASASKQIMTRSRHIARTRITSMKLVFANWYVSTTLWTEVAPGGAATVTAGLEVGGVNIGSFTLSASASMAIADGAQIETDALTCDLYPGDEFFIRTYYTNAAGIVYQGNTVTATRPAYNDTANGESARIGASGIVDTSTGTGALTGGTNYTGAMYAPVVVAANHTDVALMLLGDSEVVGIGDGFTGTSGDRGVFARPVGPYFPYSTIAQGGDSALKFVASHTLRVALKSYFTHVVCNLGVNDITNNARTAAQAAADLATIRGYFTGKPFYFGTMTPDSSSSDNWATESGQTVVATAGTLNTLNDLIRAGISGASGYFEISDVVSTARNSNKWLTDGNARTYTADGLHGTAVANELVRTSGAIDPRTFVAA